jgi:hypothetical protein
MEQKHPSDYFLDWTRHYHYLRKKMERFLNHVSRNMKKISSGPIVRNCQVRLEKWVYFRQSYPFNFEHPTYFQFLVFICVYWGFGKRSLTYLPTRTTYRVVYGSTVLFPTTWKAEFFKLGPFPLDDFLLPLYFTKR